MTRPQPAGCTAARRARARPPASWPGRPVPSCFHDGHADPPARPTPQEWEAHHHAEKALTACKRGHLYSKHLPRCPECEAEDTAARAQAALAAMPPAPSRTSQPNPAVKSPLPTAAPLNISDRLQRLMKQLNISVSSPGTAPALAICRNCQQANPGGEIYCQRCATRLGGTRPCPHCHRAIPANAKFCPRCGLRT